MQNNYHFLSKKIGKNMTESITVGYRELGDNPTEILERNA